MSVYKRGKKGTHWHYYFRVRGVRYRGIISEARTKWEAEQAESKIKQEIFEGRFGVLILTKTKSGKDCEVPMNPEVFEIFSALRKESTGRGYVFINPHTGERVREIKEGFKTALKIARIEGLV